MRLSVVIITKNEATHIQACLESVAFADEWIVVDSGSTDGTVEIAQAFGATVLETPDWPGFGPQKNRALDAATGEWVLSMDADERIPPELREEIQGVLEAPAHSSYLIPRLSCFCGRFIRHSGWYPDHILRLFARGAGRFSGDLVHERILVDAPSGRLKTPILHYSYLDDESVLHKLDHYSTLGARQAFKAGKRAGLGKALGHGLAAFLRSYIFKLGCLDGKPGVMVAISTLESTYHKYLKLMLLGEGNKGEIAQ